MEWIDKLLEIIHKLLICSTFAVIMSSICIASMMYHPKKKANK